LLPIAENCGERYLVLGLEQRLQHGLTVELSGARADA
jgi:hypothetical protein